MSAFEFTVEGTPVSHQTKNRSNLQWWRKVVRSAAAGAWPGTSPMAGNLRMTLTYYHEGPAIRLDNDNMLKPIQGEGTLAHQDRAGSQPFGFAGVNEMDKRGYIENVADRYRNDGYKVQLQPKDGMLPDFLKSYEPDIIARKNGEAVVVQVKLNKHELAADPTFPHLAGAVNSQVGWRYDPVVLNPKTWPDDVAKEAVEPSEAEIHMLIDEAVQLSGLQVTRAAFVTAWSAVEAAMREVARKHEVLLERNFPQFVMKTLYTEGLLDHADFEQLQESLEIRNATVHGLQSISLKPEHTKFLIDLATRLLELKPLAAEA